MSMYEMPGRARHDSARIFTKTYILLMVAIKFTFTCHAGLAPASNSSVVNFFKTSWHPIKTTAWGFEKVYSFRFPFETAGCCLALISSIAFSVL